MKTQLSVQNLSFDTTEAELKDYFEQSSNATIAIDNEVGNSRGFGFVSYYSKEAAVHALEKYNGTNLKGNKIRVEISKKQRPC